jgi:hypothetical protein
MMGCPLNGMGRFLVTREHIHLLRNVCDEGHNALRGQSTATMALSNKIIGAARR